MNTQVIPIVQQGGHVHALGHRVALDNGGVAELKARCLETLAKLKDPPDEIRFQLPLVSVAVLAAALAPSERAASPSDRHPAPQVQPPPLAAAAGQKGRKRG
jgi:hypothetical protein